MELFKKRECFAGAISGTDIGFNKWSDSAYGLYAKEVSRYLMELDSWLKETVREYDGWVGFHVNGSSLRYICQMKVEDAAPLTELLAERVEKANKYLDRFFCVNDTIYMMVDPPEKHLYELDCYVIVPFKVKVEAVDEDTAKKQLKLNKPDPMLHASWHNGKVYVGKLSDSEFDDSDPFAD